jgi:mannose-6-phosphate isomerase
VTRLLNPYPIKFIPILKETIWGGEKLHTVLHKENLSNHIGESWEISGVRGNQSVVSNGSFKGKLLNELIDSYKDNLIGHFNYQKFGTTFPLLFKFIDANDDLSIQLHPNDDLAIKRHNSFGKTEMWYVVDAEKDAKLYIGFDKKYTKEEYLNKFNNGEILEIVNEIPVKKGDTFFIETGTVHAIGKGVLVAEIQQTSDITYRIFDWNRTDKNGISRELHTELAIDAFDFSKTKPRNISSAIRTNESVKLVECEYFKTNKLAINKNLIKDISQLKSFIVYMCVEGEGTISIANSKETIKKGETVLIPAVADEIIFEGIDLQLLEVYL